MTERLRRPILSLSRTDLGFPFILVPPASEPRSGAAWWRCCSR